MNMLQEGITAHCRREAQRHPLCRVSTVVRGRSEEQVQTDLAEKARAWIAEFLSRERRGQ